MAGNTRKDMAERSPSKTNAHGSASGARDISKASRYYTSAGKSDDHNTRDKTSTIEARVESKASRYYTSAKKGSGGNTRDEEPKAAVVFNSSQSKLQKQHIAESRLKHVYRYHT